MGDGRIDPGKDDLQNKDSSAEAADALRQDYLQAQQSTDAQSKSNSAGAAGTEAGNAAGKSTQENKTAQILHPREQRISDEKELFKSRFQQQNFELDPIKPGNGPFQTLEQMVKDGKVEMNEEELREAAKRIRDRDFKAWGRDFYNTSDRVKLWTDKEIEQRVDTAVARIKGIDVSAHQGDIDWKKVKEAGYEFAFIKATEGGDWIDAKFAQNRQGARDAGLAVGYYHFFRPLRPVEDQVDNFVKTVGQAEPNSLRLVIDTEDDRLWKPYKLEQRIKMIEDWCAGVQKELGVTPQITIYGSPNFFRDMLENSPQLAKYSLWIANYNVAEPSIPKPWTKWDFWQYSEKGKVPGINSDGVDLNMFHGTDLNKIPTLKPRHR